MAHLEETQCDNVTIKWWKQSFQIVSDDGKQFTPVIYLGVPATEEIKDAIEQVVDFSCNFGILTQQKSILECLGAYKNEGK